MKPLSHALKVMLVVIAASALAGCTGSPAATDTPASSAAPSAPAAAATPSPVPTAGEPSTQPPTSSSPASGVEELFAATVLDPAFEAAGTITGTVTIGGLEGTLSGAIAVNGKNTGMVITMDFPGILQISTGSLRVDGTAYESQNGGPWFAVPASAADADRGSLMATVAPAVTDEGVVTRAGEQLHHLVPANADAMTGADVGMTDPSMADAPVSLELYARDDGSLAVMAMSLAWTADLNGQQVPATLAMDVTFAEGDRAVIQAPDDLWAWFTSEQHGYTIGYPTDMQVRAAASADDADAFVYSPTQFTGVIREHQPKLAADNLGAYVRAFKRATDWKLVSDEATTVGGHAAWRLAYSHKLDGEKLYFVYTLLVEGRGGYTILAVGPLDYQDEVLAFHERQLTTFSLPATEE